MCQAETNRLLKRYSVLSLVAQRFPVCACLVTMTHMVSFERARLISRNKIMYVGIHNWISKIVSLALSALT